jgi:hypothetical protein
MPQTGARSKEAKMNAVVEVTVEETMEYILHAKGCAHIVRDANRLKEQYGFKATVTTYASLEEYADEVWADIASDNDEEPIRVMFENTNVSPCAK